MRIVSLLPSATEAFFALGLGDQVVAVTHECDFPPEARSLPSVTHSTLRLGEQDSPGIETAVSRCRQGGRSLYAVDSAVIRALEPDPVVAQDVCRVCAVTADQGAVVCRYMGCITLPVTRRNHSLGGKPTPPAIRRRHSARSVCRTPAPAMRRDINPLKFLGASMLTSTRLGFEPPDLRPDENKQRRDLSGLPGPAVRLLPQPSVPRRACPGRAASGRGFAGAR